MSDSSLPPLYAGMPPSPPSVPLVPLAFGQVLERVFALLRAHYRPFLGIALVPFGALMLYYGFFLAVLLRAGVLKTPPAHPDPTTALWTVLPLSLIAVPLVLVLYGAFYGAISYAALQALHSGQVSAGTSFRHAWSKIGRYIWLMVLKSLIIAIPIMVCALVIGVGTAFLGHAQHGTPNPAALFFVVPFAVLLYLGSIVYAILVGLRLSLAYTACVAEDLTAWQAVKRSDWLTRGAKGRIFLVLLVLYAISYAFALVFYAVGLLVVAIGAIASAGHLQSPSPLVIAIFACGGLLVLGIFLVWVALMMASYSIAFAVLFADQRLRKEGLVDPTLFTEPALPRP